MICAANQKCFFCQIRRKFDDVTLIFKFKLYFFWKIIRKNKKGVLPAKKVRLKNVHNTKPTKKKSIGLGLTAFWSTVRSPEGAEVKVKNPSAPKNIYRISFIFLSNRPQYNIIFSAIKESESKKYFG
jgi:hypothetical protein